MFTDPLGNTYYKVALHQHTTRSDGRADPAEVLARYKAAGYDAVALTDHWVFGDGAESDGLLIISGCEYNMGSANCMDDVMHIVGVGMERDPALVKEGLSRQDVIDAICAAGGLAFLAHPAWSLNAPAELAALHGLSAVEIYNTVSDVHNNFNRADSGYFIDLCANQGMILPLIATDDSHFYDGTDDCISFTMVRAKELTSSAILDAIRRGDCYASQGPWLSVKHEENNIVIHCSPCSTIAAMSNRATVKGRIVRGEGLTSFVYTPEEDEAWIRVTIVDAEGRQAWSNIIPRK